jgi:hypothetical protein
MKNVRLITLIGFGIGLIAVFSIGRVDPLVSAAIGVVAVIVSGVALATSKKN